MFANCLGDSADLCPSSSHRIHRQKGFERHEFLASHPPRVFGNGDQIRRFGDTAIGDLIRLRLSYRNVMESTLAEFTTENRIEVGAIDNYITSVTPTDGHPRKENLTKVAIGLYPRALFGPPGHNRIIVPYEDQSQITM